MTPRWMVLAGLVALALASSSCGVSRQRLRAPIPTAVRHSRSTASPSIPVPGLGGTVKTIDRDARLITLETPDRSATITVLLSTDINVFRRDGSWARLEDVGTGAIIRVMGQPRPGGMLLVTRMQIEGSEPAPAVMPSRFPPRPVQVTTP